MPNPFSAAANAFASAMLERRAQALEQKLYFYNDIGAAIRMGTLVHGPGATEMYEQAYGHGRDGNSAVFACLDAKATAFTEATLKVWQREGDERKWIENHPLQSLLDMPNPAMDGKLLWHWTEWVLNLDGNAYWQKVRAGSKDTGNVVELWPLSPLLITPVSEGNDFITFYKYEYESGKFARIEPHNMVHFRDGLDDRDHRLGMSRLKRLTHEIMGDDLATEWQASMLKNGGAAGMMVSLPKDASATPEDARELERRISAKFSSGNQGKVGVLTFGATMAPYGFNPEQMALDVMHRVPEERISAVLRVPAIIAGLGAGLERATYSNFSEARAQFTELTILPEYQFRAATIGTQLKPDFTNDPRHWVDFDITEMRALQEDEDAKYRRLTEAVTAGWITVDEARSDVGLPPLNPAEAPLQLPPGREEEEPEERARRMLETKAANLTELPTVLAAMVELARPGMEAEVGSYLEGQRQRVRRALLETEGQLSAPVTMNGRH